MKKINLLEAIEKNKNYIFLASFANSEQNIIYLRFTKEYFENKNIGNNDIPSIITNKEKMLNELNEILVKNGIRNGEKTMYFYKTFQNRLHSFKFYGDCSYVTFMKVENLYDGYYNVAYFKDSWETAYRYDDYGIPIGNSGVKKLKALDFVEKRITQNELIELVKNENFKKLDTDSLNDIADFGFSSILDEEYVLERIEYKELKDIFWNT